MKITRHHDLECMAINTPMRRRLVNVEGRIGGKEGIGVYDDYDRMDRATKYGRTGRKQFKAHREYRHARGR